ncbi:MAG: PKD domain-containing protein [Bacteroidales bacterium]|nr:PKD domain-containing protein [Bacteroidales bacterium]
MKTFAMTMKAWVLLPMSFVFLFLVYTESKAQETRISDDGSNYLRLDLMQYPNFSRMLILNDLQKITDAKVTSTEETGIIFVYPVSGGFSDLQQRVRTIINNAEALDGSYDKDSKTKVVEELVAANGDWIESYAMTGVRTNENDSCHKSFPFCTNTIYTFPAGVNTTAQSGPNYNCLSTRPNPAWYHLKILDPGPIAIYMFSTPSRDIDFCLWGPYTDPITPCPMTNTNGGLTGNKVVDCSYSPNPTETANIPNGQTGQYYILIITNFSNQPCDITFQQQSGTGSTDCTILPPPATSNSPLCVGETLELSASTVIGAAYQWSGPMGFVSNQQNPQIQNVQHQHAGVYSLTITVNGQTSDPTNTEVFVYDPPTATMTGDASICLGDSTQLTINAVGVGPYRATVSAGSGIPMVINFFQTPHTFWVKPNVTTTYTLTGIGNNACTGSVIGSATVTVRQPPIPDYSVANLCSRLLTQFTDLTTVPVGGIASWNWDFGDGGTSVEQSPSHSYTNPGLYDVTLTTVANNGCERSLSSEVDIKATPVAAAGPDKTIPYGTNVQLEGSASGSYSYQWQPADKLDNATVLNPTTVLLAATTDFTLTATDNFNGCQISDQMTVNITGGPLAAVIQASPAEICLGGSTLLNAMTSGGSGIYTYSWTSNPPGFSSSLEDVTVNPEATTTYFLSIFDNFNTFQAQIQVVVNPLPVPDAGADQTIPHGTSTFLSANVSGGTPPYTSYLWSPASLVVVPTMSVTPTTNLYSSQNFTLQVTDSKGCSATGQTVVTLSGGPLQVNPEADQDTLCRYASTTIRAIPGGGSANYTYSWTSDPPGFTSSATNPVVTPDVTTVYSIQVNDGFNTTNGSVTVTVNQLPVIDLIPHNDSRVQIISGTAPYKIGICVYDTITIDAGNAGMNYLWSNGATTQTIDLNTSGISFDVQDYSVVVTNPETQCSQSSEITAYFTFQNCSYGIEENDHDNRIVVYPNPSSDGRYQLLITELYGKMKLDVYSSIGNVLISNVIEVDRGSSYSGVIELGTAQPGVYLLKVTTGKTVLLKKLVIAK